MTIKEAIQEFLRLCVYHSSRDFMGGWLAVADEEPWKSCPDDLAEFIVFRASDALVGAGRDDAVGEDAGFADLQAYREYFLDLADKATALANHYRHECTDAGRWPLSNPDPRDVAKAELFEQEAAAFRMRVPPDPERGVFVSQKKKGRIRRIFIQRLSRALEDRFGEPFEELIGGVTVLAFGDNPEADIADEVHNARKSMPRSKR
jgi:hypothetical protein